MYYWLLIKLVRKEAAKPLIPVEVRRDLGIYPEDEYPKGFKFSPGEIQEGGSRNFEASYC